MSGLILILTEAGDIHAYAVAEALKLKGAAVQVWHTADFPSRSTESLLFEANRLTTTIEGNGFRFGEEEPRVVWRRRPSHWVDPSRLHPSDLTFAEAECLAFRRSTLSVFAPRAFWVNPQDAANRCSRKILQHRVALDLGLSVPDTLYSNSPEEIRSFVKRHGSRAVYKSFRPTAWRNQENSWVPFTSEISEQTLVEADLLQMVPGIYQELVPKAFELRITFMGHQAFAAKLFSQETDSGRLDWRKSYHEIRMETYEVPEEVERLCIALMERLGIVFGCFDFIVKPDGLHVFLEVNEMGQFLFVEHYTGLPILDAFTDFLISARPDFRWNKKEPTVAYRDFLPRAEALAAEQTRIHLSGPEVFSWEGGSGGVTTRDIGSRPRPPAEHQ
jgi:glutathione synthase/RimK-type ligase-like ATP-grasp enzyme